MLDRKEKIIKFAKENWCTPLKDYQISFEDLQLLKQKVNDIDDSSFDEIESE